MPLLAEKSLPVASPELPSAAENLAEDKLSALESFLESLNLPDSLATLGESALALAASFLAALGIDLDFNSPLNLAEANQVSAKLGHCDAPAAESPKDLDAVLNTNDDGKSVGVPEDMTADEIKLWNWYVYERSCDDVVDDIMRLEGELKQLDPPVDDGDLELSEETTRAWSIAMAALKYKEENDLCNPQ